MSGSQVPAVIQGHTLVDEHEAAAYIGLSVSFLRKARAGTGSPGPTYIRVAPRAIRYRISDLEAWLDERSVRGGDHG